MDIFCVFVTKCRYFWIWIKQKISCYAIYRVFSIISSLCLGFNQKPVLVVLVSARNQYWLFLLQSETSIGCLKFNKKPVLVVSNSTRNQYWLYQIQQETSIGCLKFNKKPILVVSNSTRNQYWLTRQDYWPLGVN